MNKTIKPLYEVTTYDGHDKTTQNMTRQQVAAIDSQSVDYYFSTAFGIWGFKTAQDKWIEHRKSDWAGMGDVCIKIVQAIQWNPGEFLSPKVIAELTGRSTLGNKNALSARLMSLRTIHKESYKEPTFFLSRKSGGFAIAWNSKKTWMWIERIPPETKTTK